MRLRPGPQVAGKKDQAQLPGQPGYPISRPGALSIEQPGTGCPPQTIRTPERQPLQEESL